MKNTLCYTTDTLPKIYKIIRHISPTNQYLYIFIGKYNNSNLFSILNKLSEVNLDKYHDELIKTFGNNYESKLGLNIKNISNRIYIPELIYEDDTINIIKKKLIFYLFLSYENLTTSKINLWCIINNNINNENVINNYFYNLSLGNNIINKEYLLSIINFIGPLDYDKNMKTYLNNLPDEINYNDFINYDLIQIFKKK